MLPLARQQDRSVVALSARDGDSKSAEKKGEKAAVAAASVPVLLSWVRDETRAVGPGPGESNGVVVRGGVVTATGKSIRRTYRGISGPSGRRGREAREPRGKSGWEAVGSRGQI